MSTLFKTKGIPINPIGNSLTNIAKTNMALVNEIIEKNITVNSPNYYNSDILQNQINTKFIISPIVCLRENGKILDKKILPNGDLFVTYEYPFEGSSVLFNCLGYHFNLNDNYFQASYNEQSIQGGFVYLQLYLMNTANMEATANSYIKKFFDYLIQLQNKSNEVEAINKNLINYIISRINSRRLEITNIMERINKIPDK